MSWPNIDSLFLPPRFVEDIFVRRFTPDGMEETACEIFQTMQSSKARVHSVLRAKMTRAAIYGDGEHGQDEVTGAPIYRATGFLKQVGRLPRAGDRIEPLVLRHVVWPNHDPTAPVFHGLLEVGFWAYPDCQHDETLRLKTLRCPDSLRSTPATSSTSSAIAR